MKSEIAQSLFTIMFGLCLGFMFSSTLPWVFPEGVGSILTEGLYTFALRAGYVGAMLSLSAIAFLLSVNFCSRFVPGSAIGDFLNVILLLFLATNPWACDHLVRALIVYLPGSELFQRPRPEFKYLDLLFLLIYLATMVVILSIRYGFTKLSGVPLTKRTL